MTLEKACEIWLRQFFSNIPKALIKKAYKDCWKDFQLLGSVKATIDYPSGWEYLFMPDSYEDERWILNNIDKVEACGFLVYYSKECSVLLAIDSKKDDFFTKHWLPLYEVRGLEWHKKETE